MFLALAVVLIILSFDPPAGLTRAGQTSLALLAAVIILFISEPIPLPGIIFFIAIYQVSFGLGTPNQVAKSFMHDAVFFIMGALMIGVALNNQAIGKRLILILINKVGNNAKKISLAIITTAALLAGFIADHVVAAVLTPMVISLLKTTREQTDKRIANLSKYLLFSVAYGATIGGLYAPSGGGRNIVMIGLLDEIANQQISFGRWIILSLPITLLMIPITSFILNFVFRPEVMDLSLAVTGLREELEEREVTGETWLTLVIFVITVVLWITAGSLLGLGILALLGATLYLVFGLVDWEDYQRGVNWGVIVIYMGALSMGSLLNRTGAAGWIANSVMTFIREGLNISGMGPITAAISALSAAMTNLMSAAAAASVVGPITLKLTEYSTLDPVFVTLLTAVSTSFGFLLVIATPPNAIIYSSGHIKAKDFIKAGVLMTMAAFGILSLVVAFWWNLLGLI
ncbi:DASS family sodium-coupled anion symporter [Candidatus Bipolaricaulota bacterium]|nr:DASS family sodium-coupled anion symporter [Candidatus Bipolaricaulota bacterium]